MLDVFAFVGLPYLAVVVCVLGITWRYRNQRYSFSALSSQFLESRKLPWGSVPWHIGIFIILLLHVFPFVAPETWSVLVRNQITLFVIEAGGFAAGLFCLVGLSVLLVRRVMNRYIQAVTSTMDLVVLGLFLAQIGLGIAVAAQHRWGSQWMPATTTPYLWSVLTFRPDMSYVADMPPAIKLHIIGAWLIILLIPFSRLVHVFSLPLDYLFRRPQRVVWTNPRHATAARHEAPVMEDRRLFLKGAAGLAAGSALLTVGAAEKAVRFYQGPRLTNDEEADQLELTVKRLKMTAEEKELALERLRAEYIPVGRLAELDAKRGKYFIDYEMRPALAFLGSDGLPVLISAKCTHLGCTVQADMSAEGKILCPCHMSWFDVKTGEPNADSPAKVALPLIGWVIMDAENKVVVSKRPGRAPTGSINKDSVASYRVFLAKEHTEA